MENKQVLLELFNAQREQLNKRRDIEWKVCISFWSALIIGTGFIIKSNTFFCSIIWILIIYFGIFVSFVVWISKLWYSNEKDHHYMEIYRKGIENKAELNIKQFDEKCKCLKSRFCWLITEITMTLFLFLASFLLLITNNQNSAERISYSNFALVNNSSEEFLLDFGNITPGKEGIEVFSRIALSPRNAKLFLMGLSKRVKAFEQALGEIKLPESSKTEERK